MGAGTGEIRMEKEWSRGDSKSGTGRGRKEKKKRCWGRESNPRPPVREKGKRNGTEGNRTRDLGKRGEGN